MNTRERPVDGTGGHFKRLGRSLRQLATPWQYAWSMTPKETVRRFIDEAVNGGCRELVDELFAPELADFAEEWFGSFRRSFPDMEMKLVELVAEGDTVVGRFECSATHLGEWRGHPPTGRRFEAVDEVYFSPFRASASRASGASRTPSTASSNSGSIRNGRQVDDRSLRRSLRSRAGRDR